jgi:hypothetical protein
MGANVRRAIARRIRERLRNSRDCVLYNPFSSVRLLPSWQTQPTDSRTRGSAGYPRVQHPPPDTHRALERSGKLGTALSAGAGAVAPLRQRTAHVAKPYPRETMEGEGHRHGTPDPPDHRRHMRVALQHRFRDHGISSRPDVMAESPAKGLLRVRLAHLQDLDGGRWRCGIRRARNGVNGDRTRAAERPLHLVLPQHDVGKNDESATVIGARGAPGSR